MINKNIIIFIPSIEGYGVEKNLFIISNFLFKKFKSIKIITIDNTYKSKFNKQIEFISLKKKNINYNGRFKKYIFCSFLLIKTLLNSNNDIIISFQANVLAIIIAKFFKRKIAIRLNSSLYGIKNFWVKFILKFFYNFSNKIIVNSNDFKKELYKEFNLKSFLIYNPLDKREIIKKSQKKINLKSRNYLRIVNIGRLVKQKNQILLLKAINNICKKNLIKIEVIIIGDGILKNLLLNYIKKNKLQKTVRIISYKKNPYPYIKSADLFILTSKFEGLPNVLLEASVLKTFIISSNCPTGPREILKNGKYGLLFKNNSILDLEKKIIFFINNKHKCKLMMKNINKNLDKFSYQKNLNLYLNLISKL